MNTITHAPRLFVVQFIICCDK